ncbi:N-formylglutamate amidohydrolase [Paenibacillus thalictri]|uniref:N-formylglutamate amidohydrolase n=1 Tax=Paenibacillus thalictri TaxID=2527873 RepID=A0A4Q9DXD7_9BACL|nr:N-formylglutamate amidohydrolase [Paenibacillus thalictri]TBL80720.1 hypothetical protein EYB31_05700 [Paenibacillus thalictri]
MCSLKRELGQESEAAVGGVMAEPAVRMQSAEPVESIEMTEQGSEPSSGGDTKERKAEPLSRGLSGGSSDEEQRPDGLAPDSADSETEQIAELAEPGDPALEQWEEPADLAEQGIEPAEPGVLMEPAQSAEPVDSIEPPTDPVELTPEQEQLLAWAEALEAPFALNDYNGNMLGRTVYAYQPGSCPILVSCPHTVNHWREERVKEMDEYTGALGLMLKSLTDCHLMYTTKLYDEDPNFVLGGVYKTELAKLAQKHGIRLVIDLHGASSAREFDIDLGTQYGKTLREPAAAILLEQLHNGGLPDVRWNDTFAAAGAGTVTAYTAKHLNIQCVQVEINGKYRSPRTDIGSFAKLIDGLAGAIERIKEEVTLHELHKPRIVRGQRGASACYRRRNTYFRTRRQRG